MELDTRSFNLHLEIRGVRESFIHFTREVILLDNDLDTVELEYLGGEYDPTNIVSIRVEEKREEGEENTEWILTLVREGEYVDQDIMYISTRLNDRLVGMSATALERMLVVQVRHLLGRILLPTGSYTVYAVSSHNKDLGDLIDQINFDNIEKDETDERIYYGVLPEVKIFGSTG